MTTVYGKLNNLLTAANATTGESDTTLTDAVQTLIDGYGQGGGGKWSDVDIATRNYTGDIVLDITSGIVQYAFSGSKITSISLPNYTERMANYVFVDCKQLVSFSAPEIQVVGASTFNGCTALVSVSLPKLRQANGNMFKNCTALQLICLPDLGVYYPYSYSGTGPYFAQGCSALTTADLGIANSIGAQAFENCTSLETIILRKTQVCTLQNVNAFNGSTFANGGAGGEIYVPSALISDYQAASNWSTIHGYGTITWKAIEGSYYETHYADGTVI